MRRVLMVLVFLPILLALVSALMPLGWLSWLSSLSAGSNGGGLYWDYEVSDNVSITDPIHPIARGYSGSLLWCGSGTAGYFESALSGEPEWSYIDVVARDAADDDLMAITAYDPPDKGRVAHLWLDFGYYTPGDAPFLANIIRNAVKWAGKLVMTMSIDVSNPAPLQGDVVELYAYVRDERGYLLTGAKVWAVAGEESIDLRSSTTPPFRFIGSLDTSRLLGEVEVHFYAYFEGLGTLPHGPP